MRTAYVLTGVIAWLAGWGCQSAIQGQQQNNSSHTGGASAQGGQGTTPATGGAAILPSESLTLATVAAQVDGRRGERVRFTISGQQVATGLASVAITALDAAGHPLYWYSTHRTAEFDSPTGYWVPDAIPTDKNFTLELVVPLTNALLNWGQANVALFDRRDAISNEILVPVQTQPVRNNGQGCDPASKTDRCAAGLECNASSSTCTGHAGPSLTQVAYLTTTNGVVMLGVGNDNADDVNGMNIKFYDAQGNPVDVDIDNDQTNPRKVSSFLETAGLGASDGVFTFAITPASTFSAVVKKVGLSPVDLVGVTGQAMTTALVSQPSRGSGQSCDIHGFDYCSGNSACSPGLPGASNTCQPIGSLQGKACSAAQVIDTSKPESWLVTGHSQGSSLWEPPTDCIANGTTPLPETVIRLHVASKLATLKLSTDRRETQMDTALYVVSACGSASPTVLGCNDDGPAGNLTSELTLTNISAGDYYVIVDAASGGGGSFGLVASMQ